MTRILCLSVVLSLVISCGQSRQPGDELEGSDVFELAASEKMEESIEISTTETTDLAEVEEILIEDNAPEVQDTSPKAPDLLPEVPLCMGELAPATFSNVDKTFLRGPYLQNVGTDHATVVWRTSSETTDWGCVQWHIDGQTNERCVPPDKHNQYEVTLTDLTPDTSIEYLVRVGTYKTAPLLMHTAPLPYEPLRFLVFADVHINASTMDQLIPLAMQDGPRMAIAVGDSVNKPGEEAFDQFFDLVRPLAHSVPLWTVIGNHENNNPAYYDAVVLPGAAPSGPGMEPELYYAFRFGNVFAAVLHLADFVISDIVQADTPEVTWLKEMLESDEAETATWRLLFIHEPPFCLGWGHCEGYHGEEALRRVLVPLAADMGVAAIFSGHMHGYERYEDMGVTLVVSGGAGGDLDGPCPPPDPSFPTPIVAQYIHHFLRVDAECERLVIDAIALDGTLVDHFEIEARSEK